MSDRRDSPLRRSVRRRPTGFTLVEVLVGAVVAAIGLFATMQLALAALRGNTERRDSILAEQLAQHVLASLQTEAIYWTQDVPTQVKYLGALPTPYSAGETSGWTLTPGVGFGADKRTGALGAVALWDNGLLNELPNDRGTRFCTHYRLTWVTPDMARAEVRVSWPHSNVDDTKYQACPADMVYDVGNVGSMTLPAMVMRNVYVQ